jgi:hypothetical protein
MVAAPAKGAASTWVSPGTQQWENKMDYTIKVYQDRARTHYNYMILRNGRAFAGDINFKTYDAAMRRAQLWLASLV